MGFPAMPPDGATAQGMRPNCRLYSRHMFCPRDSVKFGVKSLVRGLSRIASRVSRKRLGNVVAQNDRLNGHASGARIQIKHCERTCRFDASARA